MFWLILLRVFSGQCNSKKEQPIISKQPFNQQNSDQGFQSPFPKVQISPSNSGENLILSDESGNRIIVRTNLVKHILKVPYTKKDGTYVTEFSNAKRTSAAVPESLMASGTKAPPRNWQAKS